VFRLQLFFDRLMEFAKQPRHINRQICTSGDVGHDMPCLKFCHTENIYDYSSIDCPIHFDSEATLHFCVFTRL